MSWLDRIVDGVAEFRNGFSSLANPSSELIEAFSGGSSTSGQRVTVQNALGLSAVFSAVKIIAETVGTLPLKVYRDLDGEKIEARDHRAWRMLHDQPNPSIPAGRFWSTVVVHLLLWGNAYIQKERDPLTGLVVSLWIWEPWKVSVDWDPRLGGKVFRNQDAPGKTWTEEQVIHITSMSLNGLYGLSVIGQCRNAIGNAMAREEFEGNFYRRGATHRGVLQHPRQLGEDAALTLKKQMDARGGSGNSGGTLVLEEGMEYNVISMPLADMEFVASTQMSRADIANIFNLPASYLNASTGDSLTYATVEGNQLQFAMTTIVPTVTPVEQALAADMGVFPFKTWFPEFVIDGLKKGDSGARAAYYKEMVGIKAMTVNEVRSRENLPPVTWGDDEPGQAAPQEPIRLPAVDVAELEA